MTPFLREVKGGVEIDLLVQPRASRSRVVGEHGGRLKVQLTSPPVDGRANEALLDLLADRLELPRRELELVFGATGRRKRVLVRGLSLERIEERLTR
jgi:hypothetical protein